MTFDDTLKFFGLVLSSSLLGSLFNQIWSTWNDRRKERNTEKKEAVYAALQIAIQLEAFALNSINKLVKHQNDQFQAETEYGEAVVKFLLPKFDQRGQIEQGGAGGVVRQRYEKLFHKNFHIGIPTLILISRIEYGGL